MLKSFPSIVGVSLIILALLLGCVVLLHEEQKPTVPPPPQTTQALSTSSVPAQSEATNDNSSYRQQTSTAISSGTPASYSTTTQTASSKPQCAERDELIMVPTSTVFTVPADQEGPFCFRPVVGAGLASSDGKWTAAIESDAKGPIIYGFAASPEYKNAGEGPELYDADRNVFILLTNLITGEKKEVSLVRVAPQQVIASLKAQGIPEQYVMHSEITEWSSDGKDLWGRMSFSNSADPPTFFADTLFKIDTATWRSISYMLPADRGVFSGALNADRGLVFYSVLNPVPEEGGSSTSTLSLNVYNLASQASKTIVAYSLKLMCSDDSSGPDPAQLDCNSPDLHARWVDSSTLAYVDLDSGKTVIKEGFIDYSEALP